MNLKYELQSIISGIGQNSKRNLIEAAAYQLGQGKETDGDTQAVELTKDQEAARLINWVNESNLWFATIDESRLQSRSRNNS